MDQINCEGITAAALPTSAVQLCDLMHCIEWMIMVFPQLAEGAALLHTILKDTYRRVRYRT